MKIESLKFSTCAETLAGRVLYLDFMVSKVSSKFMNIPISFYSPTALLLNWREGVYPGPLPGYGLQCYDIQKGEWDLSMCSRMGIDPRKLPKLFDCHEIVGTVTARASEETGLLEGVPVAAGGLDAACGTLGLKASLETERLRSKAARAGGNEYLHGELSFRSQADFESSRGAGHLAFARRLCGWQA